MIKLILRVISPPFCIFCNKYVKIKIGNKIKICDSCLKGLPFIPNSLKSFNQRQKSAGLDIIENKTYYFEDVISVFYYITPVSQAICNFKFNHRLWYVKTFSKLMIKTIEECYDKIDFDCVTYIPMKRGAERHRGYNQAKVLAQQISKELKIPLKGLLLKIKNNDKQHNLPFKLRSSNITGAFRAKSKKYIEGKRILLIDDIITTSATVNEAAKVLKLAGAREIYVATIAAAKLRNKLSLLSHLVKR